MQNTIRQAVFLLEAVADSRGEGHSNFCINLRYCNCDKESTLLVLYAFSERKVIPECTKKPHLFQVKIQTSALGSLPPIIKFWIRR